MIDLTLDGTFHQSRIVAFRSRLETLLRQGGTDVHSIRRVLAIFVELAQNIQRYSAERDVANHEGGGEIRVIESDDALVITAKNVVRETEVGTIEARLGELEGRDRRGLGAFLRARRREPRVGRSVGLGLAEIARKSDIGLQWSIVRDVRHTELVLSAGVHKVMLTDPRTSL